MFTLRVADNFHYMDESETYTHGSYSTWGQAVVEAQRIVDACLKDLHKPGMAAEELFDHYVHFGEDPHIYPTPPGEKLFSAWDYARERSLLLCS